MSTPEHPSSPAPAAPPPVSKTYPVYGNADAHDPRTGREPAPDAPTTSEPARRMATYDGTRSNRSMGGAAGFIVIALVLFVVFFVIGEYVLSTLALQ